MAKNRKRLTLADKIKEGESPPVSKFALKRGLVRFQAGARIELKVGDEPRTGTVIEVRGASLVVLLDDIGRRLVPISNVKG